MGQLFEFIRKFRYLGTEDLLFEFLVENSSTKVEFFEIRQDKKQLERTQYLFKKF